MSESFCTSISHCLGKHSLSLTGSRMMQMHATHWENCNGNMSQNAFRSVHTDTWLLSHFWAWAEEQTEQTPTSSWTAVMSFNRRHSSLKRFYICTFLRNNHSFVLFTFFLVPFLESVSVTTPSRIPSLSALLLLVPLVAAAVGVLLWRQKHISDRSESSGNLFFDSFPCSVRLQPLSAATEWCGPWHPLGLL